MTSLTADLYQGPNFLTQDVELLSGEAWQVSCHSLSYFRRYFSPSASVCYGHLACYGTMELFEPCSYFAQLLTKSQC